MWMWRWRWRSTTRSITHLVPGPPPPHIDTSRSIVKGRLVKGRLVFGLIRHAARGFYTDQSDPTVCVIIDWCRCTAAARTRALARAAPRVLLSVALPCWSVLAVLNRGSLCPPPRPRSRAARYSCTRAPGAATLSQLLYAVACSLAHTCSCPYYLAY